MKAERRHELKTNTLAHGIEGLPELWRRYGTKVLLALVGVLAIVLAVRFQSSTARQQKEQAANAFAAALSGIQSLQNIGSQPDGRAAATQRAEIVRQASGAIQQVLEDSKDPAMRAEALAARGDMNWYLATGPEVRGADTQPSLKLEDADDVLLDRAKASYEQAVQVDGAAPLTIANARLSLAAVAEQRKQWDEARKQYEQIVADARMPEAFKNEARVRLDDLKELAKPVLLGKPATAPAPEPGPDLGPAGPPLPTTTTAPVPATQPTEPPPATEVAPELEQPDPAAAPEAAAPAAPAPQAEPAPASPDAPPAPPESGTPKQ
jgi:tetratricopeptide (TPR) repeat protein